MGTGSFSGGEYDLTMRLSLFVLGIFAAIVCIASPASAQYLLMTIGQFPFITEKISEQALIKNGSRAFTSPPTEIPRDPRTWVGDPAGRPYVYVPGVASGGQ